jgi:hypothetical protein
MNRILRELTVLLGVGISWLWIVPSVSAAQTLEDPALQVQQVVMGLSSPTTMAFIGMNDILAAAYPLLGPGATNTGTRTVTIPTSTTLGTYFLLACADDPNGVIETDETNNCIASATTVLVTRPDLVEPP